MASLTKCTIVTNNNKHLLSAPLVVGQPSSGEGLFKKLKTMKKFIIKIILGEVVSIAVRILFFDVINLFKAKHYEQKKKH